MSDKAAGDPAASPDLDISPLTPERWLDLECLFGPRGACAGCWCMWWRLTGPDYAQRKGQSNKDALKRLVEAGDVPGLIAYSAGRPAGWCAVAPRDAYKRLREERVRILKRVDDHPVWAVTCFFVAGHLRRQGVSEQLLRAAVRYAGNQGAEVIEGYPIDTQIARLPSPSLYVGSMSTFLKVGFVEVLRRHEARPIMRYVVK